MRTWLRRLAIGGAVAAVAIQLVPYGRAHTNPPVSGEPAWVSAEVEALWDAACADCHSNETVWPWYTNVAPVSWITTMHVEEGRETFNVSTYPSVGEGEEAAETILEGEMPEGSYLVLHPEARLTDTEKRVLADGLAQMFGEGGSGDGGHDEGDEHEDDDD